MKYVVTLNGNDYEVEVNERSEAVVTNVTPSVAAPVAVAAPAPVAAPAAAPAAPVATPAAPAGNGAPILAPMPGTILSVNVTNGQAVKSGDVLFILEAMKMENEIVAPNDGTITSVTTTKGSTVATDDVLAYLA